LLELFTKTNYYGEIDMRKKEYDLDILPPEAELYRAGLHLFMADVDEFSAKEAIEFIIKHNLEKKKLPYLKLMVCSNGATVVMWPLRLH